MLTLFQIQEVFSHIRLPLISAVDLVTIVKLSNIFSTEDHLTAMEFQACPKVFEAETDVRFKSRGKLCCA